MRFPALARGADGDRDEPSDRRRRVPPARLPLPGRRAVQGACRQLPGDAALHAVLDALRPGRSARGAGARVGRRACCRRRARGGIEPLPWFDAGVPRPARLHRRPAAGAVDARRPGRPARGRPSRSSARAPPPTTRARSAQRLGAELAARGLVVASGLARGVDSAAHRGCLDAGGATVAVLGSGVDRIYPAEHAGLAARICERGALVSELGPGAPPLPEHFPLTEPHHQRDLAGGRRRRSLRQERLADHRAMRAGAGPGRDGGARQRAVGPQPRLARPPQGRRHGRRVGRRHPRGAGLAAAARHAGAAPGAARDATRCWRGWSQASSTGSTS